MASNRALAGLTFEVTVLQGRDLVAKDRSVLGKRTTSDPYVKVFFGQTHLGTTKMVKKNCSPTWNQTFSLTMGADEAGQFLHSAQYMMNLQIFDYDRNGADDPMGVVQIPIIPTEASSVSWYPVSKGFDELYCKNAKGDLKVKIAVIGRQLQEVRRGTTKILRDSNLTVGLAWDVVNGRQIDLDSSVVAVDNNGDVDMRETVYYGNLTNSNESIVHSGDETTGAAAGDDERIQVQLDRVPNHVIALYFILSVATPGKNFSDVKSAQARFISTATGEGICRFVPHKIGKRASTVFLVRIFRSHHGWNLSAIEEGWDFARDFGSLIPELKGYTRDLVPTVRIDPTERVAVMRKGGSIRVTDYLGGHTIPNWVTFGLAWDVTDGVNIDLDASALLLNSRLQPIDIVFFNKLRSDDGAIVHGGDEREGDEEGDDESIKISLQAINPFVKYVGIVINSYSGHELDDVSKASCHLYDPTTRADIAKYTLSNTKAVDGHTALLVGCLYRSPNDEWHLCIISEPAQGRTAVENVDELQNFLRRNPPKPESSFPEDKEFMIASMPEAEVVLDDEIVFVSEAELVNYAPPLVHATVVK